MNKSIVLGCGLAGIIAAPAQAELTIPDRIAQHQPTSVSVIPGEVTAINFHNDDVITYVILSDSSRHVYTLNAPTESGKAKSIFLRRIKPLDFPGETTSSRPNLFVVTQDSQGTQKQYEFVLEAQTGKSTNIAISPTKIDPPKPTLVIQTELGAATPQDIRAGLKLKFHQGKLDESDPIALAVAETLAISLNEDKTLIEVAEELKVPLSFLTELGRIGLAENARLRLEGDSISHPHNLPNHDPPELPSEQKTAADKSSFGIPQPKLERHLFPVGASWKGPGMNTDPNQSQSDNSETRKTQVPAPQQQVSVRPQTRELDERILTVETSLGIATIKDVQLGFKLSLERQNLSAAQVSAVLKMLAEVSKGKLSLVHSAMLHNVPLSLVSELGRLGLAFDARARIFDDAS